MNKKVAIVIVGVLSLFVLMGCSTVETSTDSQNSDNIADIETTEKTPVEEVKIDTSKEGITEIIKNDDSISESLWSSDDKKVCFTKKTADDQYGLYVWQVGEEKEKQVQGVVGNLYDIKWSPNNKYVTINMGTSALHETHIILVNDMGILHTVQSVEGPIWSLDSNNILFAVLNDKKPSVETELNGTTDLMVFDLNFMRKEIIRKGSNNYMLSPISWDEAGMKYEKIYLDGSKTETFTFGKDDVSIGEYKLSIEEYKVDNEKLSINIKYPQIIKSANLEVEDKVNSIINSRVEEYKNMAYEDEEVKQHIHVSFEIARKDKEVLSLVFKVSVYADGAAHPTNFVYGVSANLHTGEEIKLTDQLKSNVDSIGILNKILKEKVSQLDYELLTEFKGIETGQGFYLTDDSLVIYYQEGLYTPHAVGALILSVPYSEIKDILAVLE